MFAIFIILILFILFLVFLWFNSPPIQKKKYKVVKAGDINCQRPYSVELRNLYNKKFTFENKEIDPNDYEIFIVSGNSMSIAGIKDSDAVFIKRLYGMEKFQIQKAPVLIFEIDTTKDTGNVPMDKPIEFKLRKFISYVDNNISFDEWFNRLKLEYQIIENSKEVILNKFNECIQKHKDNNSNSDYFTLIFSSTLDTTNSTIQYSFHPIKFLYGMVEYVIGADKIPQ